MGQGGITREMARFNTAQSKVNAWRRCRQEYHYRYVEELIPRRVERPFQFGKIIHRMIEDHAQGLDPMKTLEAISFDNQKLFTAEKEMYGELVEDVRTIMAEYFAFWPASDLRFLAVKDEGGKPRYAEHEFELEIDHDLLFKGQIDALGKTASGLYWLVENKSFSSLPSEDHRWRNLQAVVYAKAAIGVRMVKKIDGIVWNYIKSKPPTVPQLLKSGELSQRDIVTLPSAVKAQAKLHGLNYKDYPKLMERAMLARNEYFQRIYSPVNDTVSEKIFSGFIDTSREMSKYHGKSQDKNLGRQCEWCKYEPICRAELTGGDVEYVKEREFMHESEDAHRRSKRPTPIQAPNEEAGGARSPKLRVVWPKRDGKDNPRR